MAKQEIAKKEEYSLQSYKEEGFSGIDKLPGTIPRWKVNKERGLFYHSLTEEEKRVLIINPLLSKAVRALWNNEDLPICSSQNCEAGVERETQEEKSCLSCVNAQFGSASQGKGQACKQSFLVMAVKKESLEPFIIAIPPTSLKLVGEYFQKLAAQKTRPREVYAELRLKEAASSGFKYQLITWDVGEKIEADRLGELDTLVASYHATFSEAVVERDEQVGETEEQEPETKVSGAQRFKKDDDDIPF